MPITIKKKRIKSAPALDCYANCEYPEIACEKNVGVGSEKIERTGRRAGGETTFAHHVGRGAAHVRSATDAISSRQVYQLWAVRACVRRVFTVYVPVAEPQTAVAVTIAESSSHAVPEP